MIFITLGSVVYELEQLFTEGYFDYKDLVSIGIALLIGLFLYSKTRVICANVSGNAVTTVPDYKWTTKNRSK